MGRAGQLVCARALQTTHTQDHKPQGSFFKKNGSAVASNVKSLKTKPQDLGVLFSNVQLLEIFHKQLITHTTQNQTAEVAMETLPCCLSHRTTQAAQ